MLQLGPYLLKDEAGMGIACVTLRLVLYKVRYVGHLQSESMMKAPTIRANLYGAGAL